jgi:hypothetical protein
VKSNNFINNKTMFSYMKRTLLPVDINDAAATSYDKFKAPFAGRVNVAASYITYDIEGTGAQTTQGILDIQVGGVVVGSLTATRSQAITYSQPFVVDGTYTTTASPYAEFAAGDTIEVILNQQAVTNPEGEGYAWLAIEYAI